MFHQHNCEDVQQIDKADSTKRRRKNLPAFIKVSGPSEIQFGANQLTDQLIGLQLLHMTKTCRINKKYFGTN